MSKKVRYTHEAIAWPEDGVEAEKLVIRFYLEVLDGIGFEFPAGCHDPKVTARQYLNDEITWEELNEACDTWHLPLSRNGVKFTPGTFNAFAGKLAAYLLGGDPNSDNATRDNAMDWFLDTLITEYQYKRCKEELQKISEICAKFREENKNPDFYKRPEEPNPFTRGPWHSLLELFGIRIG